jgi:signal transduction histidine kinase
VALQHRRVLDEQLRGLAEREGLAVRLDDGARIYGALPQRGSLVQKAFTLSHGAKDYGQVVFARAARSYGDAIDGTMLAAVGVQVCIFFLALFLVHRWATRSLVQPVTALLDQARRDGIPLMQAPAKCVPQEVVELSRALAQVWADYREQSRAAALGEVSVQVAHDIRSPLAALEVVATHAAQLPEDLRLIVRSAVARVRDIANGLQRSRVALPAPATCEPGGVQPHLISCLVDSLIGEKRTQYHRRSDVLLVADIDEAAYSAFAAVDALTFKRVLSNLIDNAVQAIEGAGHVRVHLEAAGAHLRVAVEDDGVGIPADILPRLGERGATFGKAGGSGLGLYHARESVRAWQGALDIDSDPTQRPGTRVRLQLPRARTPAWFPEALPVDAETLVVVADDDASVHEIWRRRLEGTTRVDGPRKTVHLSSPDEVRAWIARHTDAAGPVLFLCDYEFRDAKTTGLDLVEQLAPTAHCVLVTSSFEEASIRARCDALGVQLIPKVLAGFIPIHPISKG